MFQELSCSSCDCDQCPQSELRRHQQQRRSRKSGRNHKHQTIVQPQQNHIQEPVSPGHSSDAGQCNTTSVSSTTIGGRTSITPSMLEHCSCLTETTDCPSEFSSVSNRRIQGSRLSSRTIGSTRSAGRSSVASRRMKEQSRVKSCHDNPVDVGPDVIQLAPGAADCDPHVLRLQLQFQQLRLQQHQQLQQQHQSNNQFDSGFITNSVQLRTLISQRLAMEGIKLSAPPYTSSSVRKLILIF